VNYRLGNKLKYDQDTEPIVNNGYSVETGKLYAYKREDDILSVLDTGQGTLYYLKSDRVDVDTGLDLVQNTGTDTTLDLRWYDWVIRYAAFRACADKGSDEWLAKAQVFKQQVNNTLPSKD
jgi:hypothetical protein